MRHLLFITTLLLTCHVFLQAQTKPNIIFSGKVFDKSTNQPLEYATISIINIQSGKTINGCITNARGAFALSDIPFGTYKIDIDFIGYEMNTIDSLSINSNRRFISLGTIFLSPSVNNLQAVTVVANKPIVENKIDKIVYNAANDITSQGGAAIDVLKKVPQVTVDLEGNVELQGNSNIRFLINGKPSSVFGNNLSDALASIPASQIKSIEAVTNPGARYDSQGTGGIINIVLQDNKMQGFNGNLNVSVGTRLENGSANLNIRHNNFGINAFFSGNAQLKSQVPFSMQRLSTDTTTGRITSLFQNGTSNFQRNGFRSGIGFDWNISKNDDLTGSLGYNQFGNQNTSITNQEELVKDLSGNPFSDLFTLRNSDSRTRISSYDYNLEYKKKFNKEGQELDIVFTSSKGQPNTDYTQTQEYSGQSKPYSGSLSSNPGTDNESEFSIDYAHPVTENFIVETGAKTEFQRLHSIADVSVYVPLSDQFVSDPLQSYDLRYNMSVYAGYVSTTFKLFHYLDIKSGLRYEYTDVRIDNPNTVIPSYGTLVPSVVFSHNYSTNRSLKLSYSKRIERPEYREVNPFINLSDPHNISTGNPYLKPEIGNNFELGFNSGSKKGGNLYVALIERVNTSDKKNLTTFYPTYLIGDSTYNNVSVSVPVNIGEEYNSGIIASASYPVTTRLNLRGNLMLTHRYQVTHLSTGNINTGFRTRFNVNVTYQLPKDLVLELFINYNSAAKTLQGKSPQFFIYNFALRKLFLNKKASVGFTTTNPFNKYVKQLSTTSTVNSESTSTRNMLLRSFGVSVTYKFGKLEFSKKREENDNNPALDDNTRN
jgi:ferric enterobactin receptor